MKDKAEAGPDAVPIIKEEKMNVKKICVVCGKEYIKQGRKDSRSVCSQNCYAKLRRREMLDLPISDEEFKKRKSKKKNPTEEKPKPKEEKSKPQLFFKRDDPETVTICKRTDCIYMAKQSLRTCDYILITGHRRGCPLENCTKYTPGRSRRRTNFNK